MNKLELFRRLEELIEEEESVLDSDYVNDNTLKKIRREMKDVERQLEKFNS